MNTVKQCLSTLSLLALVGSPIVAVAQTEGAANTRFTERAEQAKARLEERQEKIEERQEKLEERKTEREEKQAERQADRQDAFCARFTERLDNQGDRLEAKADKVSARTSRFTERRGERDERLDGKRDEQDARRAALFAKLDEAADTDAEVAAVAEFEAAVNAAVAARRTTVDQAIDDFRSAVDNLVTSKKSGASDAYSVFQSAVAAAATTAKTACSETDADPKDIMAEYQAAVKAAHEVLKEDRTALAKIGDEVKMLSEARRQTVEGAIETFKAAVQAAKEKLEAAMGTPTTE